MHFRPKLYLVLLLISLAVAGSASAQTLSKVSGDGQMTPQYLGLSPMVVAVKNAQGQPMQGVTVNWAVSGTQGSLGNGDANGNTTTDQNGQTSNTLVGALNGTNFNQISVTAAIPGSFVTFFQTIVAVDPQTGSPLVPVELVYPLTPGSSGDVLKGAAGSTGAVPVVVRIASGSLGVPNVLVRLLPTVENGPSIECSGITGYSKGDGSVACNPVFLGSIGTGQYYVDVGGGFRTFGPFTFTVTKGEFAQFSVIGGDHQAGNPGATLPNKLMAITQDAAGNPLGGIPVVWEAVIPNSVTISNFSTVSDASGNIEATIKLGGTVGNVPVRVRNIPADPSKVIEARWNDIQVNLVVNGISNLAGDGQDAVVNVAYALPLIVQVTTPQGFLPGIQVQFTTTGGVTFANGGLANTDPSGRASMIVTAGPTPRTVVVTASVGAFSTSFNLTVRLAGPKVTSNSFYNGAGGQAGGVSPTAVLAIYGEGIAPGLQGCVAANQVVGPLPQVLSNVKVLFAAVNFQAYAPLYAVCNLGAGQEYVALQVPAELPVGVATVTVLVGTSQSIVPNVPVTPVSPGVFETVMSDGRKRAVLIHANDGSYVTLENKVRAGETVRAFVTGLGRPISGKGVRIGSNQGGNPVDDASPQQTTVVGVANGGVNVISTIYAPYLIGVYIVTFEVPQNVPVGNDVNFAVAAVVNDSLVFGNGSKIPIQ